MAQTTMQDWLTRFEAAPESSAPGALDGDTGHPRAAERPPVPACPRFDSADYFPWPGGRWCCVDCRHATSGRKTQVPNGTGLRDGWIWPTSPRADQGETAEGPSIPANRYPPHERGDPCPTCDSKEKWRWLDGRVLCGACLMQGERRSSS
jgi:hypothetical protein